MSFFCLIPTRVPSEVFNWNVSMNAPGVASKNYSGVSFDFFSRVHLGNPSIIPCENPSEFPFGSSF